VEAFMPADPTNFSLTDQALLARCERRMGPAARGVVEAYRKGRTERGQAATAPELWAALETDRIFRMPGLRLAETQAKHDPRVYSYLFTWPSPMMGGMLGACHALELGFVFGTHGDPGMTDFSGSGPAAEALSERMMDAWLAFARSGDPSTRASGPWARYTAADRTTAIFGERCEIAGTPYDEERRAWDAVSPSVLGAL
jgi:para-nitrobenzyl esterase